MISLRALARVARPHRANRRRWIVERITRDLEQCGAWWSISPVPPRRPTHPGWAPPTGEVRGFTVCGPRRGVVVATYISTPIPGVEITL